MTICAVSQVCHSFCLKSDPKTDYNSALDLNID